MAAARGLQWRRKIPGVLLALVLAGCSSYRVVVQGVSIDDLRPSRTTADPETAAREAAFHNDLGVFLEREGNLEGALEQYRLARVKNPDLVAAYINAGNVRWRKNQPEEAERLYREALQRAPEHPQALNNLAWVMIRENRDLDGAVELLHRALAADPDHPYLYLDSLGWALYRRGETAAGEETLLRALEETPEEETYLRSEAHYHLGVILAATGAGDEAAVHFQKSLLYRPDPERERELEELTRRE